jgi:hypothetical protein
MQDENLFEPVSPVTTIGNTIIFLIGAAFIIGIIVGAWKVFTKAGKPGWAIFVPVYGTLIMLQIVGRPWWWIFLLCIAPINIVFAVILALDTAKAYGKSPLFGILGLLLFSGIGVLILGFGKSQYHGPVAGIAPVAPPAPPAPTPAV